MPATSSRAETVANASDSTSLTTPPSPSKNPASWYQSPRERLGLGGRIRKTDVSPWESGEEVTPGKKKKKKPSFLFGGART